MARITAILPVGPTCNKCRRMWRFCSCELPEYTYDPIYCKICGRGPYSCECRATVDINSSIKKKEQLQQKVQELEAEIKSLKEERKITFTICPYCFDFVNDKDKIVVIDNITVHATCSDNYRTHLNMVEISKWATHQK